MPNAELPVALMQLLLFRSNNREGLANAARLLGGPVAERRVMRLLETLRAEHRLTRWVGLELVALHKLLSLHDVADLDRPEAYFFSLLQPDHGSVAELCLLTDQLTDHLFALRDERFLDGAQFAVAA